MTIFRSIIKKFLISKIEKYIENSKVSDGMYGAMRDLDLSEAKRDIAAELKKNINELSIEGSDNVFLNQIQELIQTAKKNAAQKCREKGKDGGSFDDLMNYLIVLACSIEFKLGTVELIDVKYDTTEALSVFSYFVALYYADAIKSNLDSKKGLINKLIQIQKGQWGTDLTDEKDTLISDSLRLCRKTIMRFPKNEPTYKDDVLEQVIRTIREVKSYNAELCREHGIEPKVSVGMTLFTAFNFGVRSYTPSTGKLEMYMSEADEAVKAIDMSKAPALT